MKKFIKLLENRLYCWKLLAIYMALTLWNAPAWCFTAFWVAVGCIVGYCFVTMLLGLLLAILLTTNERNHEKVDK